MKIDIQKIKLYKNISTGSNFKVLKKAYTMKNINPENNIIDNSIIN